MLPPIMRQYATDELDYQVDWGGAPWLETGDTIAVSVWDVPAPLSQVAHTFDDTTAKIILTGGVAGGRYLIENTITTLNGLVKAFVFQLWVIPLPGLG